MKKRIYAVLLCFALISAFLTSTVYAADNIVYLDSATVTGIYAPQPDGSSERNYIIAESEFVDRTGFLWFELGDENRAMPPGEPFVAGNQYMFEIFINLKDGYKFSPDAQVCIDGKWYEPHWRYDDKEDHGVIVRIQFGTCLENSHTHTPSEWRADEDFHYKVCTGCEEPMEQENHRGGTATCAEEGKCVVCGYAYIEKSTNHTPGPAATEKTPQKCTVCDYVITPIIKPVHTHSLTLNSEVAPTCTSTGMKAYYTCNGCDLKFSDKAGKNVITDVEDLRIAPLVHQISDKWEFDENTHWNSCALCNSKLVDSNAEHTLQNDKCIICDYSIQSLDETIPVATDTEPQPQREQKDELPWWGILLFGSGAVVAVGIVLILKRRK